MEIIINLAEIQDPEQPEEPENPIIPDEPDEPETPNTNQPSGMNCSMGFVALIPLISAAALLLIKRKH